MPGRVALYLGSIAFMSVVFLGLVGAVVSASTHQALLAGLAVVIFTPLAIRLGKMTVHASLQMTMPTPKPLPELDSAATAPWLATTCLAYPVIVYDAYDIDDLLTTMRQARDDAGAGFIAHVALVDFADSTTPDAASDNTLRHDIEARLHAESESPSAPPFLVLFRGRRWNPVERVWMGWERKRGKVAEFTDLLCGATDTSFAIVSTADHATVDALRGARYVVTIDIGSRLPEQGARRLVATIAHPSNRAVVDHDAHAVSAGFGFLRPYATHEQARTVFEWAAQPSSTSRKPPLVQRLFGQDRFFGQGIYDVVAFRATLTGRIPENAVLSHDKLEGMHGGAACAMGALLLDDTPVDYAMFRQRSHRWIRGDFHLVPWIVAMPWLLTRTKSPIRSLPALDRYNLLDDLTIHLRHASMLAMLLLGWLSMPSDWVGGWTVGVLALFLLEPLVVQPLVTIGSRPTRRPGPHHTAPSWPSRFAARLRKAVWKTTAELARLPLWVALLADQSLVHVDATVRALYRTAVSGRLVLQWNTAALVARTTGTSMRSRWWDMRASTSFCIVTGVVVGWVNPPALPWALPLLAIWFLAPLITYWTARPVGRLPFSHR